MFASLFLRRPGTFAPKPSPGPHKLRECIPLVIILRNRLKYALTRKEVLSIVMQRLVKIDGKARTDMNFPTGFMDVISIEKTGENFRILYDSKGRFILHRITDKEAAYKLCKVKRAQLGNKGIPYIATHDARTIRYPDPDIKVNDTVKIDIATGKVVDHVKLEIGSMVMVTGGRNTGRIGTLTHRDKHPGSFEIVHIRDANDKEFATRLGNIFVIGKNNRELISLPRGRGIKLTPVEAKLAAE